MKISFSYTSEKYNSIGQEVILVLSFSDKYFNYLIADKSDNHIIELKEYSINEPYNELFASEFNNIILQLKTKHNNLNTIKIIQNSKVFTLIPKDLYKKEDSYKLLEFVVGNKLSSNKEIEISEHKIFTEEIVLLSQADDFSKNISEQIDIKPTIYGNFQVFLESIIKNYSSEAGAFINIENSSFDIIIHNSEKLLLANRFHFNTAKDFCYYAIGAIHSTELNPLEQKLYISGKIMPESEIFNLLKRYVSDIEFLEIKNQSLTEQSLQHQFYNQLSLL